MSFADISSNNPIKRLLKPQSTIFSWELLVLQLLFLAVVAIHLDKPMGSISGQVALEEKGFNLSTYNMRDNRVYAIINGPRIGQQVERGAWVKADGTFEIDQLPVGEYYMRVRAPGFATETVDSVFIEEGRVNKLRKAIHLNLLNPTVNIASESRVFTTKEPPHFWINASGAAKATVKIYKKDLFGFIADDPVKKYGVNFSNDFSMYVDSSKKFQNPFINMTPVKVFTRDLNLDVEDNAHAEFKFDSAMAPGDYFAVAEVVDPFGKNSARTLTWFSVGDVGLVVKHSPTKTIVRAVDLNTLKGVSGVRVKLLSRADGQPISEAAAADTAGGDGLVTFPVTDKIKQATANNLIVTGDFGSSRAYAGFSSYSAETDVHKTYFYTDRPVYRLGQTVYFKGISRIADANGMKNLGEGKPVSISVEDPDNNNLTTIDLKTNKHGTFHGLVSIPADSKTGGYQVQITYPDGHIDYNSFEVAEYRKPEYQVEVTPLADKFIAGDKARAKVKASYYFGGPVANARVKYSVYSSTEYTTRWRLMDRPSYFDFFNSWSDGEDGGDYEGTGDFVAEGYAVTDANGEAIVEVQTQPAAMPVDSPVGQEFADKKLKFEAEVTDISRLSVVSSGSVNLVPGDFFLSATPANYVVKVGEPIGVDVIARDYTGKPVASKDVQVRMVRYPYDRIKSEYKPPVVLSDVGATTNAEGKTHVDISVGGQMPSDSYSIQVTSKDAGGHFIADDSSVWVSNSGSPFSLSQNNTKGEPLTVKMDKKVYKPGETARVIIAGPFNGNSGMDAMVSIEGRKLHDLKIVPLTSSAQLIEVPIKEEYCPNFYITVSTVGAKRQFYTQEEIVKVSPETHFLKLAVATDKDRYKPGETVNYTISARDTAGKPVKDVEVSLGVVDESIYAIRSETAPDIKNFFYDRIPNSVSTFWSFPEQYSGGPDKMEPRVRKDFRDTAAWVPELTTDANGEIHTQVKLPDNLTTWRATVRGINGGTEVGATTNKVVATQDIIARLALPRFFSTGDEGIVTAVVHNYSGKAQHVKLALSISPLAGIGQTALKLGANPESALDIVPDGAGRVSFPVTASTVGKCKIKLVATCPTGGDALEKEIYVKPMGIPVTVVTSGCLTKDTDEASLQLPAPTDADPNSKTNRTLALATSSIGPVLGNFSSLIDYPYGCTEQTMSRLVPSVVAMQLNKKLGVPLAKGDSARFGKVYTEAMAKLTGYQHGDGGWGWWANDDSNPYLTSLVIEGFKNLSDVGYKVDDKQVKNGLAWLYSNMSTLTDQLADPKRVEDEYLERERTTDLAYMFYAQSLWPHQKVKMAKGNAMVTVSPGEKVAKYLLSKRDKLTPVSLAYLCRALHNRGKEADAGACLTRLIALANTSETTVDWDATKEMAGKLGMKDASYFSYRFTNEETSALALQALVEVSGKSEGQSVNQAIIEKIKAGLFLQRGKDGWENTKTTAAIFKALLADELALNSGKTAGGLMEQVAVAFSGSPLKELTLGTPRYVPETNISLPLSGALNLKKNGAGRLYYSVTTDYYNDLTGAGANATIANLPNDLKIERTFYHLTSQASTTDGTIHVKSVPIEGGKIKAGETILMKVKVTSPRALPYIIVQADLPSGAEVVQSENQMSAVESDNEDRTANTIVGDWDSPWWTHQDILDDKIVFFGTNLRSGKSEFTTLLRVELPGKVNVNPIMLEGMYTKGIKAFSMPLVDKLEITE